MNKILSGSILLFVSILLTGCLENQSVEEIGIVNAQGIDITDDNLMDMTFVVFQFSEQSEEITKIVNGKGKTLDGAADDANHSALYPLEPGKIKLMIYGKEMAEQGILPSLDSQSRDARIPDLMYLAVSETTAKETLNISEQEISLNVGQYLHGLIDNHSRNHNIPRKTLADFYRIYYDVGKDNALPIFELPDKVPKLKGVALFKGDQMVGQIEHEKVVLLNLMDRTVKERVVEMTLPLEPFKDYLEEREEDGNEDEVAFVFLINKGNSKTKLVDFENLVFETDTKMEIRFIEQSAGITLEDTKVIKTLEKEIGKNMENRFNKILTELQEMGTDPFGYGRYYKKDRRGKDLTNEEWRELYPSIDVKFNVDVQIQRHGVID